jgi:alcohol dehydrogenase class IV
MWRFRSPKSIYFGKGSIRYFSRLDGKKAFIVTDVKIAGLGIVDKVIQHLKKAGVAYEIFDRVEAEPSKEIIEEGVKFLMESEADWILAVGGGSCIDAAKAIWIFYERPDLSWKDIIPGMRPGLRKKARFAAVPTTSGTGADVSWGIVITDKEKKRKLEFACSEAIPDFVVLDSSLASEMPPRLTADTGMDALAHAIESYVATLKNDFSDALSLHAARLIFDFLPKAYSNGKDVEAREKMHHAATLAGLAFGNSQAGLAHSLGHSLGGLFELPHGRCVGLFLPYVIEYNSRKKEVDSLYKEFSKRVGKGNLAEEVRNLIKLIENPVAISELVEREEFFTRMDLLVEYGMRDACTPTNPVFPSEKELRLLYQYAYEGRRIDF